MIPLAPMLLTPFLVSILDFFPCLLPTNSHGISARVSTGKSAFLNSRKIEKCGGFPKLKFKNMDMSKKDVKMF
jgi:hypothetical protein